MDELMEIAEEYKQMELKEYMEKYQDESLRNQLAESLQFTQNSAAVIRPQGDIEAETKLAMMIPKESYVESMRVLTNNFDPQFTANIQKDMDPDVKFEQNSQSDMVFSCKSVREELKKQLLKSTEAITVVKALEAKKQLEEMKANLERELQERYAKEKYEQEQYEQQKYEQEQYEQQQRAELQNDDGSYFSEMFDQAVEIGVATVATAEMVGMLDETLDNMKENVLDKPIEIVEGSDGVLNTSRPEEVSPNRMAEAIARIDELKASREAAYQKGDIGNRENSDKNKELKNIKKDKIKPKGLAR